MFSLDIFRSLYYIHFIYFFVFEFFHFFQIFISDTYSDIYANNFLFFYNVFFYFQYNHIIDYKTI